MATLFRPVGLYELSLIWDANFWQFPPRRTHQPYFYPVTSVDYARHIAAHWNVSDEASGRAGFVTRFGIADKYLSSFEPHVVGTSAHVEYWIPALQLGSFNEAITGVITVEEAFFGSAFVGYIPDAYGLKGRSATEQFIILAKTLEFSRMDFVCEVSANRKAVYLNSWFWGQHDFAAAGLDSERKREVIRRVCEAWEFNKIKISLPPTFKAQG